jgi:hypothetical protein
MAAKVPDFATHSEAARQKAPKGYRRLRRNEYLKKGDVYYEDTSGEFLETEFFGCPANWGLDVTPDLFYYRRTKKDKALKAIRRAK